jgi:hypothetical protein
MVRVFGNEKYKTPAEFAGTQINALEKIALTEVIVCVLIISSAGKKMDQYRFASRDAVLVTQVSVFIGVLGAAFVKKTVNLTSIASFYRRQIAHRNQVILCQLNVERAPRQRGNWLWHITSRLALLFQQNYLERKISTRSSRGTVQEVLPFDDRMMRSWSLTLYRLSVTGNRPIRGPALSGF